MLSEPQDLDQAELAALLERHWRLEDVSLRYLPVGFGSHHWQAEDAGSTRWFVTVDELERSTVGDDGVSVFVRLEAAFGCAAFLRDDVALDFVVAPLRDESGAIIRRLGERYAVTVSPFVEGTSGSFGRYDSPDDRRLMGNVLGRLHVATESLPAGLPRTDDLAIPARAALEQALQELDDPWSTGPFAERTRRQLRASAESITAHLERYDELAAGVRRGSDSWVLTHGEPHSSNVIRDERGGLHLVDWDTTLLAPRERDLRMVLDDDRTGWEEYVAVAGPATLDEDALELYRRWWDLTEIALYTDLFRRPHEETEDTSASWTYLGEYLRAL